MRLSCGLTLRPALKQSQRLTLTQQVVVKQAVLALRLRLVEAIHGANYNPQADCPRCGRKLTPFEIVQGFRSDPNDYTTKCTSCGLRYEPKLVWRMSDYSSGEIPFYCSTQVLARIESRLEYFRNMTPEEIQREDPAVYHSVRVHYGNFRVAFAKIGIQYQFEQITNWQERIADFLGKLPDTVIATVVDVPVAAIRNLRKEKGVPQFNSRRILAEAGE